MQVFGMIVIMVRNYFFMFAVNLDITLFYNMEKSKYRVWFEVLSLNSKQIKAYFYLQIILVPPVSRQSNNHVQPY